MALMEFRKLENPPKEVTVTGSDGKPVAVSVEPLSGRSRETVLWALEQIKLQYRPEVFDVPIEMILGAAAKTGFLESASLQVSAHSWGNDTDNLLILFSIKLIRATNEFVVTLLHQLMFFLLDESDFSMDSSFEARLDLDCYRALGFQIPADHWAFKKSGSDPAKKE